MVTVTRAWFMVVWARAVPQRIAGGPGARRGSRHDRGAGFRRVAAAAAGRSQTDAGGTGRGGGLLTTADADGTVRTWHVALFSDPYAALCADVGPPTRADWTRYAPSEMRPKVCT